MNPNKRKSNAFTRSWAKRLTLSEVQSRIDRLGTIPHHKREYIKSVLAQYDHPYEPQSERHITDKEFEEALQKMQENPRDRIEKRHIESIRNAFR